MIKLKGCPRCQGDLYLKQDNYGKYYNCFQCGYMKDLTGRPEMEISGATAATAAGERKAA
jgi:DNA-directed RNA polymerase subunit M/transcription elongation factor TFIIS